MIEIFKSFVFSCDVCKMGRYESHKKNVTEAKKEIKKNGWKTQKKDGKTTHICSICVRKNNKSYQNAPKDNYSPSLLKNYPNYFLDYNKFYQNPWEKQLISTNYLNKLKYTYSVNNDDFFYDSLWESDIKDNP